MSNAARSGENEDVFGDEDTAAIDQAAKDIEATGGTQYEVGKGGRRRGRKKTNLRKLAGGEQERDPADQAEINRLADEQAKDDADPREQGPPAEEPAEKVRERAQHFLDGFDVMGDTAVLALKPQMRRALMRGLIDEAVDLLAAVKKDTKKRGIAFDADLRLVSDLCGAAAKICAKTSLPFEDEGDED